MPGSMKLIPGISTLLFGACLLLGAICPAPAAAGPNILFIVADDLRPDLGCYGNRAVHSPNLDRLAARGMVFNRAYCQVALCNPSRASVLTGRRPDTTRVLDNGAHFRAAVPDVVTLPQFFKQHGRHAVGLGKIFHPGLDDAASWSVPHWDPQQPHGQTLEKEMKSYYGAEGQAIVQKRVEQAIQSGRNPQSLKRRDLLGPAWEAPEVADADLTDGQTATRAVEALRESKDRPFFLAIGFLKPHLPFVAPKKYWDLYPPEEIRFVPSRPPQDAPPCALHDWGELRAFVDLPKSGPLSNELARQMIRGYRAATSYMDAQVGRLLDELDRLGLREKTIVVFWGDHGWQLGEHGLWCKHTNFEVATRAPLILSVPGMASAGQQTNALVELVDIYPTLAELCGLAPPPHLEGTSFAPLLKDPQRSWKPAAFSQYPRGGAASGAQLMGYSMRTDRYRFTRWVHRDDPAKVDAVELYDHQTDPNENVNIAGDPKHTGLVRTLTGQWLTGWRGAMPGVH